jgi:hypothetical protein
MAAIQPKTDGSKFAGSIDPAEPKFFIDIHKAAPIGPFCKGKPEGIYADWFMCQAAYEITIKIQGETNIRGAQTGTISETSLIGSKEFVLDEGFKFSNVPPGRCHGIRFRREVHEALE